MDHPHIEELKKEYEKLSADGFRVLAIAVKDVEPRGAGGAMAVTARPTSATWRSRATSRFSIHRRTRAPPRLGPSRGHGVAVKVLTGDNDLVARKVCKEVGLPVDVVLLGDDVEKMSEAELADKPPRSGHSFARVSPAHKQRIIRALQSRKHTVGFMGDGINDAPALHAADVGISVDSAVDIAKESADIILLEKSLLVLDEGVIEGRKVFSNIIKYVRMGASSNFGNMFSVLGASVFVPYLPMLPIQILANNLLYDIGQTAIPDRLRRRRADQKPRSWDIKELTRFIIFIGPCSSIFDYSTYFIMLYVFHCWDTSTPAIAAHSASLFQTGGSSRACSLRRSSFTSSGPTRSRSCRVGRRARCS
jgi:P-type Mg2+ transporter